MRIHKFPHPYDLFVLESRSNQVLGVEYPAGKQRYLAVQLKHVNICPGFPQIQYESDVRAS
jgi:hypothetical protein